MESMKNLSIKIEGKLTFHCTSQCLAVVLLYTSLWDWNVSDFFSSIVYLLLEGLWKPNFRQFEEGILIIFLEETVILKGKQ